MTEILRCEDEQIHIPENIQSFGYLFALEADTGRIVIHSANISDLLISVENIRSQSFYALIDESHISQVEMAETFRKSRRSKIRLPIEIRFRPEALKNPSHPDYFAIIYESGSLLVVEIEPALTFKGKIALRQQTKMYSMATVPRFRKDESISDIATSIADMVRNFTGYERVLVYKFNVDKSGVVIAESKIDDIESYMDMYYPESDIPAQARALYKKNWLRVTANADSKPIPLVPSTGEAQRAPLDMTNSILRSMSPVHLQYLRNQGLLSSMSVSLYSQDELWGLIICHHRSEYYLPQDMRLEVESLAHLFSWQLYAKEEEFLHAKRSAADTTINDMISQISDEKDIGSIFSENEHKILSLMGACGFLFSYGDLSVSLGEVPNPDVYSKLFKLFSSGSSTENIETTNLFDTIGVSRKGDVLGALVLPLLSENNYYTIWFRKEHSFVRRWAGNPNEKSVSGDKAKRLMPRSSFVIHEEMIESRSLDWTTEDKRIANLFNKVFLQHALRSQVQLKNNIELLTAQDKSKNEFLATLAHELRNPLAPISSAVELIRLENSDEARDEAASIIERQIKQLVTLIDDLMDVSRITRGRVALKREKKDIRPIVVNAIDSLRRFAASKAITIVEDLADEEMSINVDVTRLTQVLANVINNAVKYTPSNGTVEIRCELLGYQAVVTIKDNGIGISKEYMPSIFEMFSQADPFSPKGAGGLGIGLTLSKRLIDLHGGQISAASEGIGRGSTFTIKVPIARETAKDEAAASGRVSSRAPGSSRIMVVDDNVDSARMLELVLKTKGHIVKKAHTGRDGLALFHEFKPEVVLLDIGLPDIDGYEICKAIRATEHGRDVFILAQTGWGQSEHLKRSAAAGFDKHLVKPIQPAMLWSLIEEFERSRPAP